MTHGINYGYDCYETDPSGFTRFLDYVKEREDRIWVATFRDVAGYTKAAEAVCLNTEKKGNGLVISPAMPENALLKDVVLTMEVASEEGFTAEQDGRKLDVTVRNGKSYFDFNPFGGNIILR